MKHTLTFNLYKHRDYLVVTFTGLLAIYSLLLYFVFHPGNNTFFDTLYYFFPVVLLLVLIRIGKNHENLEGIALIGMAIFSLSFYRLYFSLFSFFTLATTGVLFLLKEAHSHSREKLKK
jgi:uncharacterized membrane protein